MKDPIVDEVRKIRAQHQSSFNDDWDKIINDLKQIEQKSSRQMVTFPAKKVARKKTAS